MKKLAALIVGIMLTLSAQANHVPVRYQGEMAGLIYANMTLCATPISIEGNQAMNAWAAEIAEHNGVEKAYNLEDFTSGFDEAYATVSQYGCTILQDYLKTQSWYVKFFGE